MPSASISRRPPRWRATPSPARGSSRAPDGTGTSWRCEVTDVRDFSFVVNPRFRLTETDANGTAIRVYTETVSGAATAELARTALIGLV